MTTRRQGQMIETVAQLDLYVATTGNDANSGLTPADPLATYDEAVRRVNVYSAIGINNAFIHIASGAYTATVPFRGQILKGSLVVIGDGAGQPGDDGFTELLGSTAALAGSGTQAVVTGGGLGVNVFRGKTIEVLTGAAAGDRRTIQRHTDTTITPVRNFTAAVAAGDTFRIVEPAIDISISGSTLLAVEVGGSGLWGQLIGTVDDLTGSLYFVNLAWTGGSAAVRLVRSSVVFMGNERVAGQTLTFGSDGLVGMGADTQLGTALVGTLFGTTSTAWAGWSLTSFVSFSPLDGGTYYGYFVATTFQPQRCSSLIFGGSIINTTQTAILPVRGCRLVFLAQSAPNFYVETTSAAGLDVGGGNTPVQADIEMANMTFAATTGTLVRVRIPGARVAIASTVTGTASSGVGINASWGSQVSLMGAVGLLGNAGNDITVDNGVNFVTAASLAAAGQSVFNPADGSLVVRIS